MRVEILKAFSVDGAKGSTRFGPEQVVSNGQRNWVDKGLAKEVAEPAQVTATKSADTPQG